jgi:hypothetical protein
VTILIVTLLILVLLTYSLSLVVTTVTVTQLTVTSIDIVIENAEELKAYEPPLDDRLELSCGARANLL